MKSIFESSLFDKINRCYNPELGFPYTEINKLTVSEFKPVYTEDHSKFLIILDNGHGNDTKGKCSPCKTLKEYAYTRKVTAQLSKELDKLGITNIILVPEENDVSLQERVRRANIIYERYNDEKKVFLISVHINAYGTREEWKHARGWTAYTSKGFTESDVIAKHFYMAAEAILGPKVIRKYEGDKNLDFEENFYILCKTCCPAVLTENFFMDNKFDCEYLLSEEGFQDVVDIHLHGIMSYINKKLEN